MCVCTPPGPLSGPGGFIFGVAKPSSPRLLRDMREAGPLLLFAFFIAGVFGLIVWAVLAGGKRTAANLTALANRLGLQVQFRTWGKFVLGGSLHGTIAGRTVRVWSYTTGSGKSQRTWSAVGVRPRRDDGFTFKFDRQGFVTKVMEVFGSKEVRLGDRAFDDAWFVQTNRPDFLAAALLPEIREKIMTLFHAGPGVLRLEAGEVAYVEEGSLSNADVTRRLEAALPLVQDLADVAEVSVAAT
jgi:hypothetical protein